MCVCVCVCECVTQTPSSHTFAQDSLEEQRAVTVLPQPNEVTKEKVREHLVMQQKGITHLLATLEDDMDKLRVMHEGYQSGKVRP